MNQDGGGTFLEDKSRTLELVERYWDIDMEDFALLTSQPVASYHSRIVDVHGDMCLGKKTTAIYFPFRHTLG